MGEPRFHVHVVKFDQKRDGDQGPDKASRLGGERDQTGRKSDDGRRGQPSQCPASAAKSPSGIVGEGGSNGNRRRHGYKVPIYKDRNDHCGDYAVKSLTQAVASAVKGAAACHLPHARRKPT